MTAGIPRSATGALFLCLALTACHSVGVEETAVLTTQPGAELVRLAPLDGCCSIVVGSPTRGTLDVFDPRATEIGSFLSGLEGAADLELGNVGGRPVVFVNGGGAEVTMLTNDLIDPQRLRHPNRVYRSDTTIHALAAVDLDQDGIDELVVARGDGLKMIDRLEVALFADPEHVPDLERDDLPNGLRARDVGAVDLDGDAAPEIIALDAEGARARIWRSPGFDREGGPESRDVELSARGVALTTTDCDEGAAAFAVLEDGAVVSIDDEGAHADVPVAPDATGLVGAGDGFLVLYEDGSATLHDACGEGGGPVGLDFSEASDVHLTRRLLEGRRLAVVREDGRRVALYRVDAGY